MATQKSQFNRVLLVVLAVLYVLTIAGFSYTNWVSDPAYMLWWRTLFNILVLSIPFVLLYGSTYILVVAWRDHTTYGQVSPRLAKIIHWAPRVAAIVIIIFISLFSLDVFEMEAPLMELLGGFLIHNIPSFAMIVLLVFAWKRPAVGFVAFLVAAVLFGVFFVRDVASLPNLLVFVLPILLVAGLFYGDWKWLPPQPPAGANPAAQV